MKFTPPKISTVFSYAVIVCLNLLSLASFSQGAITVDGSQTPSQLASLISGNGVSISNVNVRCNTTNSGSGYGKFTSTVPALPISDGLLLTTGNINNAIGPNTSTSTGVWYGNNEYSAVAADSITTLMNSFSNRTIYEYCLFEFDIIPQGDSIFFDYVFASEEYNEWVGSNYNDVFGFFIKGPGIVGNTGLGNKLNLARVNPNNGTTAVAINSVNAGSNASYYQYNAPGSGNYNIGYDGFTKNLYAKSKVMPCSTYRLQMIIADCGDRQLDSGVFIEKIRSNAVSVSASTAAGVPQMIEGCNPGVVTFTKPTTSVLPVTVNYWLSGTAVNGTDYPQIGIGPSILPRTITFPSGATTATLNINPIQDGINETGDTVVVSLFNIMCPAGPGSLVKLGISDSIGATISPINPSICPGSQTPLTATGALSYSWSPAADLNTTSGPSVSAHPTASKFINVETKIGACKENERVWVNVKPAPGQVAAMPFPAIACRGAATQVIVPTPQPGVSYSLFNNGPGVYTTQTLTGTDTLTFLTGNLTGAASYSIVATHIASACTTLMNAPINVSVDPLPTALAINGDEARCYVSGNSWVTFVAPGTNRALAAVNANGQNLGWVTIKEYVDAAPINVQACNTSVLNQPQFNTTTMSRRWVTNPENQPTSNIGIRFFVDNSEFNATKALANANANPYDDLNILSDLALSKYSGPNEDGDFANNCNSGGTTSVFQSASSGNTTALYAGFHANGRYVDYTIPSCSEMWLHGINDNNPSPLPVVLSQFAADCIDNNVHLTWTTASEVNNAYFSVQKSENAYTWEEIAQVEGAGNSNTVLSYDYIHTGNRTDMSYYRIVQFDYNGDSEAFPAASLYCGIKADAAWSAFPNPNNGQFQINVLASEKAQVGQISIVDMAGKSVFTQAVSFVNGVAQVQINAHNLAHGAYVVRINGAGLETLTPIKIVVN